MRMIKVNNINNGPLSQQVSRFVYLCKVKNVIFCVLHINCIRHDLMCTGIPNRRLFSLT